MNATPGQIAAAALVGVVAAPTCNRLIARVPARARPWPADDACYACGAPPSRPESRWSRRVWLRCAACRAGLRVRDYLVAVAAAALFGGAAWRFGAAWALPAFVVFFAALLVISVIDLEHHIVPNLVVYPTLGAAAVLLSLAALLDHAWQPWVHAAIGGVCACGALLIVHLISPRGMGFGDVRLAGLIGVYLGWLGYPQIAVALFLGFVLLSVVGLGLIVFGGRSRKDELPFGPALALGAVITVLWGAPLVRWFLPAYA